jgi:hypothetical protein
MYELLRQQNLGIKFTRLGKKNSTCALSSASCCKKDQKIASLEATRQAEEAADKPNVDVCSLLKNPGWMLMGAKLNVLTQDHVCQS